MYYRLGSLMAGGVDVDDIILNYDPESPQARFVSAKLAGALTSSTGRLPSPVPWPDASKPVAVPLDPAPAETDDLTNSTAMTRSS